MGCTSALRILKVMLSEATQQEHSLLLLAGTFQGEGMFVWVSKVPSSICPWLRDSQPVHADHGQKYVLPLSPVLNGLLFAILAHLRIFFCKTSMAA